MVLAVPGGVYLQPGHGGGVVVDLAPGQGVVL